MWILYAPAQVKECGLPLPRQFSCMLKAMMCRGAFTWQMSAIARARTERFC